MRGVLLTLLLFAGPLLLAQTEPGCLERTIPVRAVVRRDSVPDMSKLRYRASVSGKPVEILSKAVVGGPQRVVLVIDTRDGMGEFVEHRKRGEPDVQFAFEMGNDALKKMAEDVSMALLFFGRREQNFGFAADRRSLSLAMEQPPDVERKAGTRRMALLDALLEALHMIPSPHPGDAIYVISDGFDRRSKIPSKQLIRRLQVTGVQLFALQPVRQVSRLEEQLSASQPELMIENPLPQIVERSGGHLVSFVASGPQLDPVSLMPDDVTGDPESRDRLDTELASAYRAIASPTLLRVRLPRAPQHFQSWKLEALDERGGKAKEITLSYPRELAPCARP